jgi:hypothetical protein
MQLLMLRRYHQRAAGLDFIFTTNECPFTLIPFDSICLHETNNLPTGEPAHLISRLFFINLVLHYF